jgi:chromosome segregation ATPase
MEKIALFMIAMMILSIGIVVAAEEDKINPNSMRVTAAGNSLNITSTEPNVTAAGKDVRVGGNKVKIITKNYKEARERYENAKDNFKAARNKYLECQENESEECEQIRENVRKRSQEYAAHAVDKSIKMLENIKDRIEKSNVNEEVKANFIAKIDAEIEKLKDSLENLEKGEVDIAEIRKIAQQVQKDWAKAQAVAKRAIIHNSNMNLGNVIEKSDAFVEKINELINSLQEKGYDTSMIEENLAIYEEHIANAAEARENAVAAYKEIKESEDSSDAAAKARTYMKKALEELKESHMIMKEIVQEIRSYMKQANSTETTKTS